MAKTPLKTNKKKTLNLLVCACVCFFFVQNYSADSRFQFPHPVSHPLDQGKLEQWQVSSSSSIAFVLISLRTGIMTSFRVL